MKYTVTRTGRDQWTPPAKSGRHDVYRLERSDRRFHFGIRAYMALITAAAVAFSVFGGLIHG